MGIPALTVTLARRLKESLLPLLLLPLCARSLESPPSRKRQDRHIIFTMVNELARYTESDWNVDSVPHVEEKGVEADGLHSYLASKTLAEKALWSEFDCIEREEIFAHCAMCRIH